MIVSAFAFVSVGIKLLMVLSAFMGVKKMSIENRKLDFVLLIQNAQDFFRKNLKQQTDEWKTI